MNKHDLLTLQQHRADPAISVLLPTHRTSPDNKRDPIVLKNLLTEAVNRLEERLGKRDAEPLVQRLEQEAAAVDFRHTLDGLAIFVSADHASTQIIAEPLPARVVLDATFATRDLVFALNRSPRYWVLALSEQPSRLYEGTRETLVEVRGEGFPMEHTGPGGGTALPKLIDKSKFEDEHHQQFFRRVDQALEAFTKDDPLPVVVVGVERWKSHFREVTRHRDLLTSVRGSHDATPPFELAKLVWPAVRDALSERRAGAFDVLGAAVGAQRSASGLPQVWRKAVEGRVERLLVEEGYRAPARLDADGALHLVDDAEAEADGVLPDAIDEVIERVMATQGTVTFVDDGTLGDHERVAATLRY